MLNSAVFNFAWKSQILRFIYHKLDIYDYKAYTRLIVMTIRLIVMIIKLIYMTTRLMFMTISLVEQKFLA